MKKILGGVAALLFVPQALMWGFFLFVRFLGLDSETTRILFASLGGVLMAVSCIVAGCFLHDDWIPDYSQEQRRLRERREQERADLMRQIDEQVGIPRIGRPS